MPLYEADKKTLTRVERTTFKQQGWHERRDIQTLMKSQIDAISPNTLIVAEEFDHWADSQRRIDLLGVDKDANLVVIELKRDEKEDYRYMELQAIRYAAMISNMTFDKLVPIYQDYLDKNDEDKDAASNLREFLGWNEPGNGNIEDVKIVLASAEFSKELTTSVMWLNDFGLDIRCVRMRPYKNGEQILLDIQTIIPLPEVADYQIQIQEKKQKERESKKSARDYTKYDVYIAGEEFPRENKRGAMFRLISGVLESGGTPKQVMEAIPRKGNRLFGTFDGKLNSDEVKIKLAHRKSRFHCEDDELFYFEGDTYVLSNEWWDNMVDEAADTLSKKFPALEIRITRIE